MNRFLRLNVALASLVVAACVTINVYFPAAAAEKAADRIIDQVTGAEGQGAAEPPKPRAQGSALPATPRIAPTADEAPTLARATLGRALEWLVPAAHAQADANLDISSPEIRAITASMQARFGQLETHFASGAVGLTADGLVEIRDANAAPLAERAGIRALVAEDNRDRNALYAAIARANGHPEWESDIRRTFARRWVERGAQPGWYYQDASGAWRQK